MTVAVDTGLWQLDASASSVGLKHKTLWGLATVEGTFGSFAGQGEVADDGSATGIVTLQAASLDTRNAKRDEHLRSADFFHAERHPEITFAVDRAEPHDGDTAQISGRLTVRGTSRPLSFPARIKLSGSDAVTVEAEFSVDREQFGMDANKLGMIRGLTTITATLGFTRATA